MAYTDHELAQLDRAAELRVHHAAFVAAHSEYLIFKSAQMIASATKYCARVGKKELFATPADAVAYDRGFSGFPNKPWGSLDSPAMRGYLDAEAALAEQLSVTEDRREFEVVG